MSSGRTGRTAEVPTRASSGRRPSAGLPETIFVTGLHRSGTTVLAESLVRASDGVGLTAGHLARYLPELRRLLAQSSADGSARIDRGVDRRRIEPALPEEYCWYLRARTGAGRFRSEFREHLVALIHDLEETSAPVVLKNPWDTGSESALLASFPGARVVIVRRTLADVETSQRTGLIRIARSNAYLRALLDDERSVTRMIGVFRRPALLLVVSWCSRWRSRLQVLRLLRTARRLPLDRVAFVSYDEFAVDPVSASRWAGHIVEPARLADAFRSLWHPESSVGESSSNWIARLLDRRWRREWQRLREAQLRARVVERAP